jgi:Glycosyl hydrolase family 9
LEKSIELLGLQILGMSYFFYEVARSGRVPPSTRAPWRGDSLKSSDGGSLDGKWEGGYFDAGDHNIFQLPQAYSIARLAWTVHAFPDALQKTYFDVRRPKNLLNYIVCTLLPDQS